MIQFRNVLLQFDKRCPHMRLFSSAFAQISPKNAAFYLFGAAIIIVFLGVGGCRPERFVANADLELRCETDTVLFDTCW